MHDEYIQRGEILPKRIPTGPNNPLGSCALYLGKSYAIHDANTNFGIGLRITRGCIRLKTKDMQYLYALVPIGTRVQFINDPIKLTTDSKKSQYLEIHKPLDTNTHNKKKHILNLDNLKDSTYLMIKDIPNIDYTIVNKAIQECSGIPINITTY